MWRSWLKLCVSPDIPYRVVIIPMKKLSIAMATVNPWVCVSGEMGDSGVRQIPKNTQEIYFQVCVRNSTLSVNILAKQRALRAYLHRVVAASHFSVRTWAGLARCSWGRRTLVYWPSVWSTAWWCTMRSLDTPTSKSYLLANVQRIFMNSSCEFV